MKNVYISYFFRFLSPRFSPIFLLVDFRVAPKLNERLEEASSPLGRLFLAYIFMCHFEEKWVFD